MVGERPTLFVLPGLGLGPEAWEPTLRHLHPRSSGFEKVVVLSLPGYGMPAAREHTLAPAALARLVSQRLAGAGPAVIAGHSASCQVAAHATAQAGATVLGLALIGPTTDPRAREWSRLVGRWLATARHERIDQVPSLVRQYRRTTLRSMARAMDAARCDDLQHTLLQVRCPVLVVRGGHDRICPGDWAQRLGPTITIASGAHMVPLTHGARVAQALRSLTHTG